VIDALVASMTARLEEIPPKSSIAFVKEWALKQCIPTLVSVTYLYTRAPHGEAEEAPLAELSTSIGRGLMRQFEVKKHSAQAAKLGGFFLYSLEDVGLTALKLGTVEGSKHNKYLIEVVDTEGLAALWRLLPTESSRSLPHLSPAENWTRAWNSKGEVMVKTGDKAVLHRLAIENQPLLFKCINRVQNVGWTVDIRLYQLQQWAFDNREEAFKDIWSIYDREAKASKVREYQIIHEIADKFLGDIFYHRYYYDFRSRIYPATAYLHEQGADTAKGLLRRSEGKALGREGFRWLLIAIATKWAGKVGSRTTDKIPLQQRFRWGLRHLRMLMGFAESPKINKDWMNADSPWQFMLYCMELRHFMRYWGRNQDYDFESTVVIFIDGSTNGLQHLSALSRDAETAEHVNLVPRLYPGDLYAYIGAHMWDKLREYKREMDSQEIEDCETFIDHLAILKSRIASQAPRSEGRFKAIHAAKTFKEGHALVLRLCSPVFWLRITESGHIRKIVKREQKIALVKPCEFGGHPLWAIPS